MSERNSDDIRALVQSALPRVDVDLRRDLWPAMSLTLKARTPRVVWYDWVLAGLAGAVIALFPNLILVLVYHL